MQERELIWVPTDIAVKYKRAESDNEKERIVIDYMDAAKKDYQSYIENLDDDVLSFKGSMIKMKSAFREAKDEQLKQSYELWERFEEEMPKISNKIKRFTDKLDPVVNKIESMKIKIGHIDTCKIDRLIETIERFERLDKESRVFLFKYLKDIKKV